MSTPPPTRDQGWFDRGFRWAGSWPGIATISGLVVAAVGIVLLVTFVVPAWDDCAPGVDRVGPLAECVGISDNYAFDPSFDDAMNRFAAENDRVERLAEAARQQVQRDAPDDSSRAEDRLVTLVYVLPVPVTANGLTVVQRHELEGAYVAQRNVNTSNAYGGDRPLFRILVANSGENGEHTSRVVELIRSYPDSERIAGVLGFDLSRGPVEDAIRSLAGVDAGCDGNGPACDAFPVFTSLITADDFAGLSADGRLPHVARVAPTNSDQAEAAAAALAVRGRYTAVIIQDTNPDDSYAATLGARFAAAAGSAGAQFLRTETYDSADLEAVPRRLFAVAEEVCRANPHPDVVYFAGRAAHLRFLVDAAQIPACQDEIWRMNIWTGDDGVNADVAPLPPTVTLAYTTLAHPDAWSGESAGAFTPGGLVCPDVLPGATTCFAREFGYPEDGRTGLEDGGAIIGHDVVLTAVAAIRASDPGHRPVTRSDVISVGIPGLHGSGSVPGGSGWISICNDGNPAHKAVPILELSASGVAALRAGPVPAAGGTPYVPGSPEQC